MIDNDTSNSHLKDNISQYANFKKNNTPVPEDLIVDIFNELRVSKLIVPGIVEDDDVIFQNIMFDDKFDLIPLFTDADEFKKYTTEYTGITNDFSYYVDLVMKEDLDGMVINLKGDMFFIDKFLLQKIPHLEKCDDSDVEGYDGQQLRDIYRNLPNKKLIKFINNPKNFNKYDKLIKLLFQVLLIYLMSLKMVLFEEKILRDMNWLMLMREKKPTDLYILVLKRLLNLLISSSSITTVRLQTYQKCFHII